MAKVKEEFLKCDIVATLSIDDDGWEIIVDAINDGVEVASFCFGDDEEAAYNAWNSLKAMLEEKITDMDSDIDWLDDLKFDHELGQQLDD